MYLVPVIPSLTSFIIIVDTHKMYYAQKTCTCCRSPATVNCLDRPLLLLRWQCDISKKKHSILVDPDRVRHLMEGDMPEIRARKLGYTGLLY